MAFQSKTDYYGLATTVSGMVLTDSTENKATQVANGMNEKGDIVAYQVFGETKAPTCTYVISNAVSINDIEIGKANGTGEKYVISGLNITTGAGAPPKIEVSGEMVPSGAATHNDCYYDVPAATLQVCHHAQILWSAFSLTGSGCYLTQANYTAGGDLTKATKDGETVSFDVANGQLTAQVTIMQTDSTAPTLTPGSDWTITSPLTVVEADAQMPTWNATLSRYLTHHA